MPHPRFLLACLCAGAIALSGCQRDKLSTAECSAMLKKQVRLLIPNDASGTGRQVADTPDSSFAGQCDEFGKEGRTMYECTMAAHTHQELDACMIERETGVKLKP